MYQLQFDKRVFRDLDKIPKLELVKIHQKISRLKHNPRLQGSKKLKGGKNLYRIRQGVYRILYSIVDKKLLIIVVAVKHRKFVYNNI